MSLNRRSGSFSRNKIARVCSARSTLWCLAEHQIRPFAIITPNWLKIEFDFPLTVAFSKCEKCAFWATLNKILAYHFFGVISFCFKEVKLISLSTSKLCLSGPVLSQTCAFGSGLLLYCSNSSFSYSWKPYKRFFSLSGKSFARFLSTRSHDQIVHTYVLPNFSCKLTNVPISLTNALNYAV